MKTSRIAGIVAAATLAAGAVTGATVALAADNGTGTQQQQQQDGQLSAPNLGMGQDGQGRGPGGDHGPGGDRGPGGMGDHGPGDFGGPRGEMGGHMLHSEGVIEDADGNYVTVRSQEGEVTAISATSISVKSSDGYTATYVINDSTTQDRDRTADTSAKVGDTVHVRATVDGSTATADDIHAMSPDFVKQMEQDRAAMQDWMSQRPDTGNQGGQGNQG